MPVHGSDTTASSTPLLCSLTMPLNSATGDSPSIFRDGKLKPGAYKIQNIYSQAYLDIHEHSREACCRPAPTLKEGKGLVRLCYHSVVRVSDTSSEVGI